MGRSSGEGRSNRGPIVVRIKRGNLGEVCRITRVRGTTVTEGLQPRSKGVIHGRQNVGTVERVD